MKEKAESQKKRRTLREECKNRCKPNVLFIEIHSNCFLMTFYCYLKEMTSYCYLKEMTSHCYLKEMASYCYLQNMTSHCYLKDMTSYCFLHEMTSHCYLQEMTSYCYLQELTSYCYLPEMTSHCHLKEMTRRRWQRTGQTNSFLEPLLQRPSKCLSLYVAPCVCPCVIVCLCAMFVCVSISQTFNCLSLHQWPSNCAPGGELWNWRPLPQVYFLKFQNFRLRFYNLNFNEIKSFKTD